ncbi:MULTISPECIES: pyridoxal phosphate-dependent aminotransferase [Legionella]|uniref:Aminotransferase n=1 Tax=Legionella septentrionalis TaxID=2498109 RepID=A0A433JIY0_9GAMM|nr:MULTISPECIES: pyridoxal phosphate-dependent aminotransferase [Legionella]MCP0913308.1 pyridoxal phosphate-dependent aminotransferase [Legionella sp. 27cVA30]RUQ85192.1 pyridoxal phosphate-dependent aminotransferase [Legionella septentrionalis]RUQ97986.1 pyridoxal phosphate-dependent aminotransferase [Legionella septentrionalis]RUR09040.1 pyridoxal phosphate-dependent aminotransferase [Legionella septentrionalis]RUR14666.1 pyridoxal phosphate-dependent aminotransferase [Legionella septentrio
MLTPNGQSAHKIEKVMLLAMWANTLNEEVISQESAKTKKLIFAGLGKPTYPISTHTISSHLSYWQRLDELAKQWFDSVDGMEENPAIDYGDPRGDTPPRQLMAEAMSKWYAADIAKENILFTVGGIAGLGMLFDTLNARYTDIPGYRVVTPFPHYSAYANNPVHRLHPVEVMNEPGFKIKAHALEASIREAYRLAELDNGIPKAVLICNPSNPLGNIVDEAEMLKIAEVLRKYPDLHIIFDEAYAEMCYKPMPSFLKLAPDLKERTIILRSATKAFSAAGERMAVMMVFDPVLMNELLNRSVSYFVHAPRSAQIAYAQTMANFEAEEHKKMSAFYKKKVDYVIERLHDMGANVADPEYQVEATFYALGDFSDLFGLELPEETFRALQKKGKVQTGEDIAYYLLFKDSIMIAPLSYFGLPKDNGIIRITCSDSPQELKEMMDRLEQRLLNARKIRKLALLKYIEQQLLSLEKVDASMHQTYVQQLAALEAEDDTCLNLKVKNQVLSEIQRTIAAILMSKEELLFDKKLVKTLQPGFIAHHEKLDI